MSLERDAKLKSLLTEALEEYVDCESCLHTMRDDIYELNMSVKKLVKLIESKLVEDGKKAD